MRELLVEAFLNNKILDGVLCHEYFVLKFSSIRSASKDVFFFQSVLKGYH